ncbi:MAG TPA: M20/M25/M40 family metallo-hydrolase [Candidatus Hydrogenedentes bacterium]|nr:M20/M25/M40 family metallo-hydrolase [Candidatus Hydrogenedentota bacterium]
MTDTSTAVSATDRRAVEAWRPWGTGARRVYVFRLLLGVGLLAGVVLAIWEHIPPAPLPASAPTGEFSARRAFEHVRAIAVRPHPAGSPACEQVRQYITDRVRELGLDPQVQRDWSTRAPGQASLVENVVVRIPGSASTGAVALVAHYDSVAFGPGAADDTAGVATLLETMRALVQSGFTPMNDLLFVFTDGEEGRIAGGAGLRGAWAFANRHPLAADLKVVLNFDCRGTQGPSYMYECGTPEGWLIRQLRLSGARAVATSVMVEVYRRMPVASDLTMFLDRGITGLNFAFINGLGRYHTALDAPEYLSLRSLQHHGDYAIRLARRLGAVSLHDVSSGGRRVFFHFPGVRLVSYGMGLVWPFTLCAVALYVVAVWVGLRRGRCTIRDLALCKALAWGILLAGVIAGGLVFWLTYRFYNFYFVYYADPWVAALLCLTGSLFCVVTGWFWRARGPFAMAAGWLSPWAVGALLSAWRVPTASYLFTWPLLFGALVLLVLALREVTPRRLTLAGALLLALCAFPVVFFVTGMIQGAMAAVLLLGAPMLVALLLMLMGAIVPQLLWFTGGHLRAMASFCLGGAVALSLVAIQSSWFSGDRPRVNSLTYALDADSGDACWLSCDAAPDYWTAPFLGDIPARVAITDILPEATRPDYLRAPAPALDLAPPELEVLADTREGDRRVLTLRVHAAPGASVVSLYALGNTRVLAAKLEEYDLALPPDPWFLTCSLYREPFTLTLILPADHPARFRVTSHAYGLPAALNVPPRPRYMIPKPNTVDFNKDPLKTDETIITRVVTL